MGGGCGWWGVGVGGGWWGVGVGGGCGWWATTSSKIRW